MLPSPSPERAFAVMNVQRVTTAAAVPAVAQRWIDHQRETQSLEPGALDVLQVGGSRLPDELAAQVRPVLGATLQQVFGMAEGLINMTRLDDSEEVIVHTQGRPISEVDEIMVLDETGSPLSEGKPGALLTRGPYTPRGYFKAPNHNVKAFTPDGWYRSGDIVIRRPDGNLVVVGRDKDISNRGGEKVSADEVENFAYQVPGVRLAAAIAMPDTRLGEKVALYVVPTAGETPTLTAVIAAMNRAGVAKFKLPERLVLQL